MEPSSDEELSERAGGAHSAAALEAHAEVFLDGRGAKRFVLALLAALLISLVAVASFNIIVDPWGTMGTRIFPTAIESDRALKFTLVQKLHHGPDILILGSSRSRMAQPAYLQKLTGRSGFNAGVTGGDALDELVFTRMMYHRFPSDNRRYLIFVSAGVASDGANAQLLSDPRAQPYLPADAPHGESLLERIKDYISVNATEDSLRVVRACVERVCKRPWYAPDGSLLASRILGERRQAQHLKNKMGPRLAKAEHKWIPPTAPSNERSRYFVDLLAWMNQHGARPVIVFVPYHPALESVFARRNDPTHTWDVEYLRSLQQRFDFVFLDLFDIRTFGGSPNGFYDPTHVTEANMRLMLDYVVAHDQGVL